MSKLGYKTKEPFDIQRDEPTLIAEVVKFYTNDLSYSDADLIRILGWYPHEVRKTYIGVPLPGLRLVKG